VSLNFPAARDDARASPTASGCCACPARSA
jgi:hypothetical protein